MKRLYRDLLLAVEYLARAAIRLLDRLAAEAKPRGD